jgi:AcrR family transcriptional regulator
MALYRYFPSKAALLDLMIDSASDAVPAFGRPSSTWSVRLKEWARLCLLIYETHPWFLAATTVRCSLMGPNELSWMEAALAMLAESGLRMQERHNAFLAIIGHVRGHATFQQIKMHNKSGRRWIPELARMLQTEAHRYPVLLKALVSGAFDRSPDTAFEFGLDCILDGIRARAARYGTPKRSG